MCTTSLPSSRSSAAALPGSEKTLFDAFTTAAVSRSDQEVEGFASLAEYGLLLGLVATSMDPPKNTGKNRDVPSIVRD